jgi:hypothetical protein
LLFFFLVKNHVARDAALIARIKDVDDFAVPSDLGRGKSLAQIGHQSRGRPRRQRQYLRQAADESFDLILIVDHWAAS